MKKFLSGLVLASALTLILSPTAFATTHEITKMSEILSYVDSNTLVVFDIDNTLAEAAQTLGSVQWQEWDRDEAIRNDFSYDDALIRSVDRFAEVNQVSRMRPVEQSTPSILAEIQTRAAAVMALTARPIGLLFRSRSQLLESNIDLSLTEPIKTPENFSCSWGIGKTDCYAKGIYAVGPFNNKGTMLLQFMRRDNFAKFSRVLFVDDKLKYVEAVEQALAGVYPVETFRYGAADARVKAFDPTIAAKQWEMFSKTNAIVSDNDVQ